jgi:hypothetical protein
MVPFIELAAVGLQQNNSDTGEVGFLEIVALQDRRLPMARPVPPTARRWPP